MPVHLTCRTCGDGFDRTPSQAARNRFCSQPCARIGQRQRQSSKGFPPIEREDGITSLIPLQARDGSVRAHAIVDTADADWVAQWRWHLHNRGYAVRILPRREGNGRGVVLLHRALLGLVAGDGLEGDHINHDRLDCRRSNLRVTTKAGNRQNMPSRANASSQYRGVYWYKARGKWGAQVKYQGRQHNLGLFSNEEDAAEAARRARLRLLPFTID